jgi:serine/threonine protein kinase
LKDFLKNCLEKDPTVRKTAAELLEHPFITNGLSNSDFIVDLIKSAREVKKNKKTLSKLMDNFVKEEEENIIEDEEFV